MKVHKDGYPLRPVLSLPGSMYENLTNELAKLIEDLPGAGIETSSQIIRDKIKETVLKEDEQLISLDVKSLYTNVPIDEAISLAADRLYESKDCTIERTTFTELMRMALVNIKFKVGDDWYQQIDGLAMGSKLAVYLANMWMKGFESKLGAGEEEETEKNPYSAI